MDEQSASTNETVNVLIGPTHVLSAVVDDTTGNLDLSQVCPMPAMMSRPNWKGQSFDV